MWMLSRKTEILINAPKPVTAVFFCPSSVCLWANWCTSSLLALLTPNRGADFICICEIMWIFLFEKHIRKTELHCQCWESEQGSNKVALDQLSLVEAAEVLAVWDEWASFPMNFQKVVGSWRCKFKKHHCRGWYNYTPNDIKPWSEGISRGYLKHAVLWMTVLLEGPSWVRSRDSC